MNLIIFFSFQAKKTKIFIINWLFIYLVLWVFSSEMSLTSVSLRNTDTFGQKNLLLKLYFFYFPNVFQKIIKCYFSFVKLCFQLVCAILSWLDTWHQVKDLLWKLVSGFNKIYETFCGLTIFVSREEVIHLHILPS